MVRKVSNVQREKLEGIYHCPIILDTEGIVRLK